MDLFLTLRISSKNLQITRLWKGSSEPVILTGPDEWDHYRNSISQPALWPTHNLNTNGEESLKTHHFKFRPQHQIYCLCYGEQSAKHFHNICDTVLALHPELVSWVCSQEWKYVFVSVYNVCGFVYDVSFRAQSWLLSPWHHRPWPARSGQQAEDSEFFSESSYSTLRTTMQCYEAIFIFFWKHFVTVTAACKSSSWSRIYSEQY